jgi:mRNA-degrading endonuclease RelE of RelBE toxin-antitoxin system
MTYEIRIDTEALDFLESLDDKSSRIIKNNLQKLEEEPYPSPDASTGDREEVTVRGEKTFRMHISRSYTAFYNINENLKQVIITEIVDIDKAHKMYD